MTGVLLTLALLSTPQDVSSGEALLKAINEKLSGATSVTGKFEVRYGEDKEGAKYDFKLLKPNLYVVSSESTEYRFDGQSMWMYMPSSKTYTKSEMTGSKTVSPPFLLGVDSFFHKGADNKVVASEKSTFREKPAVTISLEIAGSKERISLFVDEASKMPLGWSQKLGESTQTISYSDLKLDPVLTKEQFAWTPPTGAKPFKAFDPNTGLLPIGSTAPEFSLVNGTQTFKLSESLKGSKGTLVVFWFTSEDSPVYFKELQDQYAALSAQGLRVVAVNYGDAPDKVQEFKKSQGLGFPVFSNGLADSVNVPQLYKVSFYPTTYLVGPDGKVLSRFVQFEPGKLAAVLKSAGFTVK